MKNLSVKLHNLELRNPVLTASGTFGYGWEYEDFVDLSLLGGIIVKATTANPRKGNPYPRMAETPMGMLNAIGLQNKGVHYFVSDIYPKIKDYPTQVLVNVSGSTIEEYEEVAEIINDLDNIPAIELNISCPNVKEGGMAFGTSCTAAQKVTAAVRRKYKKTMIVKLSPNVTSIAEIAKAVEDSGADALSLINTLMGMAINSETRRPVLSTITGGLSGPAIKPVAVRMVWQVYKAVKLPIIGIGGIMTASDAIEFMLAGAAAIQVGTANFIDPQASVNIAAGIADYLQRHDISCVRDLTGGLMVN
ncbi:MAG TPA: dihydroorotate dehydrogenase [Bacteroidales bacterium]|nr:dihydroorotate dehydrogenase [Bacteroidales bacterium]